MPDSPRLHTQCQPGQDYHITDRIPSPYKVTSFTETDLIKMRALFEISLLSIFRHEELIDSISLKMTPPDPIWHFFFAPPRPLGLIEARGLTGKSDKRERLEKVKGLHDVVLPVFLQLVVRRPERTDETRDGDECQGGASTCYTDLQIT